VCLSAHVELPNCIRSQTKYFKTRIEQKNASDYSACQYCYEWEIKVIKNVNLQKITVESRRIEKNASILFLPWNKDIGEKLQVSLESTKGRKQKVVYVNNKIRCDKSKTLCSGTLSTSLYTLTCNLWFFQNSFSLALPVVFTFDPHAFFTWKNIYRFFMKSH
jgi:hypothetical protein